MRRAVVTWSGVCVGLAACAGELARPHRGVEIVPPEPVDSERAPAPADAFVPVDARPPRPDADVPEVSDLRVFVRVRTDEPATGLRAALEPPQPPASTGEAVLDGLGDAVVPVFEWDRPADGAETRLLARLAVGTPSTALYAPGRFPDRVETDVRHLGAFLLDDVHCAAWDVRPLLFLEPPGSSAVLADALERLAVLPRPPAVLLGFDALQAVALPAGLSVAATASIVGRWPLQATGWASDLSGDLPGSGESRALAAGWQLAESLGPVLPRVRAARNARLDTAGGPFEAPGTDRGLLRSLVLGRRVAPRGETGGIFVEALGGWRDDGQLDPLAADAPAAHAPETLTGGLPYPAYGSARLEALRATLLDGPSNGLESNAPPAPDLAELHRSDSITVSRLESVGPHVEIALRDRTASGRWEVLLSHRRFRVPERSRVRYARSEPTLRVEWVLASSGDTRSETLKTLSADAPATGALEIDVSALAGQVVDSVVLVYEGGAGALQGRITLPVLETAP